MTQTTIEKRLAKEAEQVAIFNKNADIEPTDNKSAGYKAPKALKKDKDDLAIFGLLGGGAGNLTFAAAKMSMDDKTTEQMNDLASSVKAISGAFGTVGLAAFAFQTAAVAMGLKGDRRKVSKTAANDPKIKDKPVTTADKPATKTTSNKVADIAEQRTKAPEKAKTGKKPSFETKVTDIGDKRTTKVAKEAVEAADKPLTKVVAKELAETAVKTAAEPAAKGLFGKIAGGALKTLKLGKKLPFGIGSAITTGFVAYEVGTHWAKGDSKMAFAAAAAGSAEIAGNLVGFGVGDGFREAARLKIIKDKGEEYSALNKSDIRIWGETALELKNEFTKSAETTTVNPNIANGLAANESLSQPITGLNLQKAS